ncbi:hypothetical protein M413DRAFT_193749 [Hebeloma cylindrosporum]|uniref:Uncharacterized protein n=1 Tax=Hebeloma cylindrosporum TaxID=76867 RepID=A0A0C2XPT0_HEBCY|nr:hypothetical protein M413DRAFT_193749 [Hebeloma cylindrosporum h7]
MRRNIENLLIFLVSSYFWSPRIFGLLVFLLSSYFWIRFETKGKSASFEYGRPHEPLCIMYNVRGIKKNPQQIMISRFSAKYPMSG